MSTLECPEGHPEAIQDGPSCHVEDAHLLWWLWSPAPQLRAQMQATTAVAMGLPCHIHLHARAPLIVASAPLHAGNKAHRKCTQSECSALHCCHSFCPQGDHSSVQQPCRPLLLREHPDLQQCSGDKNVTCGPGAWQAVSTFPTSPPSLPPGPPGKGFRGHEFPAKVPAC